MNRARNRLTPPSMLANIATLLPSGASCTLNAGSYVITVAGPAAAGAAGGLAVGPSTPAYGIPQASGRDGSVTLTAIAAPTAVPTLGHLALALLAGAMGMAAAWRRRRAG